MRSKISIILIMCLCILSLTGCGKKNMLGEDVTRVSIIFPHKDDEYWTKIQSQIEQDMDKARQNDIDIKMYFPELNYNVSQMVDIIYQQITAKVDVIVVQGVGDESFVNALKDAYDRGIRVIFIDTDLDDFPEHLYIGTDNYNAGYEMGKNIVSMIGPEADVTVMSGEEGYPNLEIRIDGLKESFKDYPNIEIKEILYDNYDGMTVMKQYNNSSNDDVIIFVEGTGAQTISRIFTERDTHFKYLFGFDITDGVENGVMDGVIMQSTSEMGKVLVDELIKYKKDGSYSDDKIYTETKWVTKKDYDK